MSVVDRIGSLSAGAAARRRAAFGLALAAFVASGPARATESVNAALCREIDEAAARAGLPASFLTRLIWSESSFRADVVSPAGAQGIAQFMPATAAERGLANPFDPQAAIAESADLLADLKKRFGNLGLAAAAYNAGAARVTAWLEGRKALPLETQAYVVKITGRRAEDWMKGALADAPAQPSARAANCRSVVARLRLETPAVPAPIIFAPWGVQLAAGFSRRAALAAFSRSLDKYRRVIGATRPMIIGTRLLSRGYAPFYRIRIPEPNRAAAERQCRKILAAGGACVPLRS